MRSFHETKHTNLSFSKSITSSLQSTTFFTLFIVAFLCNITPVFSQGNDGGGSASSNLVLLLFGATLILIAFLVIVFSDKMIKISADEYGTSTGDGSEPVGILPSRNEFKGKRTHRIAGESEVFKLKRGFDIKIQGRPVKVKPKQLTSRTFALKPINYRGIQPIPKMAVEEGQEVKAGDALFFDKGMPDVKFCSPVSGEVVEINRGEKRAIEEVVILADSQMAYKQFQKANPRDLSREQVIAQMKESGTWVSLIERPFGLVADPEHMPKSIFISMFDTSPLAPDYNFILGEREADFRSGIQALQKLTEGSIHLGLNAKKRPLSYLNYLEGVEFHWFEGKHPAGNVGIQIHHIDPIKKGEVVWTINPIDVATIGKLFNEGVYSPERIVSVGGPQVKEPGYFKTLLGANVEQMLQNNIEENEEDFRVISGNVLTGAAITEKGHLGAFDHSVSVIKEGDFYEFMGWLLPSYPRPSKSITFPWTLFPFEEFDVNTNTHGEERAFVMTGQYEEVLPMDLYPVHLLKAILSRDFDQMEGLGIYEVLEEDLALCEFVCTSKQPVQEILRDGLDYMKEQS